MNLPILSALQNDQSTYITLSKSLMDFDQALSTSTPCYFSKMIALNLPIWQNSIVPDGKFFIDLNSVGVVSDSPNICFPKVIQYYLENILRFNNAPEIAELAFWKTLEIMGMSDARIRESVSFVNSIVTSNFIVTENNNGWMEIVCQIPNNSKKLTKVWKLLPDMPSVVQGIPDHVDELGLYDNGTNQFLFPASSRKVLDFDNLIYDEVENSNFDFNTLLLFYKDGDGVDKLHGINFIYPYENKVSYWDQQTFTQRTNDARSIGYQFKFNMKSCNNTDNQTLVYQENDHSFYNQFADVLSGLNSFLEVKMRESANNPIL